MTDDEKTQIFTTWLHGYKAMVFKIVRAYAFSPESRDDLFQEISVQLWRSVDAFRGECSPSTWIYRISLNTAISWLRREKKYRHARESIEPVLQERFDHTNDQLRWLYDQIAGLDEIDRSIALMLLDGVSYQEMALVLGITESNIGVKIHRIKKVLTKRAKEYDYGV